MRLRNRIGKFTLVLLFVVLVLSNAGYADTLNIDDLYIVPEYETYNSYASENGRAGDLLHIQGTISEYTSQNSAYYFVITQSDGKQWMVTYGYGNYVLNAVEGYEGEAVDLYGEYQGFSDLVNLPALTIMLEGGIRTPDGTFVGYVVDSVNTEAQSVRNKTTLETHGHFSYEIPDTWIHIENGEWDYYYAQEVGSPRGGYIAVTEYDFTKEGILEGESLSASFSAIANGMTGESSDAIYEERRINDLPAYYVAYYGKDSIYYRSIVVYNQGYCLCFAYVDEIGESQIGDAIANDYFDTIKGLHSEDSADEASFGHSDSENIETVTDKTQSEESGMNIYDDEEAFFSAASPADLLYLRQELDAAIRETDIWEEVNVSTGTYQVGVDIPAGVWSLKAGVSTARSDMMIGEKLKENGKEIDYWDSEAYYDFTLANEWLYKDVDLLNYTIETIDIPEGYYVEISKGSVIFTPYAGKTNFMFFAETLPDQNVYNTLVIDGLDYAQLIELKDAINLAIWSSYDWDRVLVPFGIYKVGEDIPAGDWLIEPPEGSYVDIGYGNELNARQMNMKLSYSAWSTSLKSATYRRYKEGDTTQTEVTAAEGCFICVSDGIYSWFKPSREKSSLGFKQFGGKNEEVVGSSESTLKQFTLSGSEETPLEVVSAVPSEISDTYEGVTYLPLEYEDTARNPGMHTGEKIYFTGEVIQVYEASRTHTIYRIRLDSSDIVLVHRYQASDKSRILKDDKVIVYATSKGVESYESTLGGTITIPACTADAIVLQ